MQRMSRGCRPSALAMVARSGKTPWLWVQTASLPSLNSATAQEGAIAWRPHHAAMHHARKAQVLHEGGAARHLGRDVDARRGLADNPILCGRPRRHLGGCLALEVRFCSELTVADLAAVRRMDDAIRDLERVSGDAELPGGEANEQGAHLGARHA